jgi:hypothetical protein
MTKGWQPKNFDEACKRNAGRRKLHARKREARANRIVRLLQLMETDVGASLKENTYGWLSVISNQWKVSAATASRDLALSRQIRFQFLRMFGREFVSTKDKIKWSWDFSHYGFITTESKRAGHKKAVGKFPFNTRDAIANEEAYCGFNSKRWHESETRYAKAENDSANAILRTLQRLRF